MKLFFNYLKTKSAEIIAFLCFSLIFLFTFTLYRIPLRAVFYPALLCIFFGAVFILAGFLKFRKKHERLEQIKKMTSAMISSFPEPAGVIENDLIEIAELLRAEISSLESGFTSRYRDMTEYYTVWAHQIKTPIASMKLTLQNEDSELSRRLSAELFRIEQYVEMVLAFLRLDSESGDYVFREYGADAIIKQSVKKYAHDFISKKIRLEYSPVDIRLVTDEKWLSFVIEQILSNSLKYTREGAVKIYMKEPKLLCIEDTGIGIAPEDLPRIFEKGYTGCNGRADKSASGIGLYLCRRICQRLGIGISVSSEPGKGTVVTLDLAQEG